MKDKWQREREMVLAVFYCMLSDVTGDGSEKRQAGEKPPWYEDDSHMAAVWSHFRKDEQGKLIDPDSKAHPKVHAAWRLLAEAYRDTFGSMEPPVGWLDEFKEYAEEVLRD